MAQTGKKINELTQISTVTNETVLPGVYVESGVANSTASKISIEQISAKVQNDMSSTLASKQDTLVSGGNIKTLNGNSILGTGDLAVSTYQPFNNSWTTNSTFTAFLNDVYNDDDAIPGMAYLGGLTCSGLPTGLNNVEAVVEIIAGSANDSKVIHVVITSGTTSPYRWEYTYWYLNNSFHNSGWISFQPSLPSGTTGYYLQKTSNGVQWSAVDALPDQTDQSGKFLTTNGTTASWATVQVGGGAPTLTWYTGNTGTTLTIEDTSSANLVKVYRNGILLQPADVDSDESDYNFNDYSISGTTLTLAIALTEEDKITLEVF